MNLNKEHKEELVRQYNLLDNPILQKREHQSKDYRARADFQRDYQRILYSNSFRRLQGKMQVLGVRSEAFFRNRLTHSLEVAQVAFAIAEKIQEACKDIQNGLYSNDHMFVLQAAALGHDIGHPAFGHSGERVLDKIGLSLSFPIRFEGNAQNFRVLRNIEKKDAMCQGLNLTNRVLLAINKYLTCENTIITYDYYNNKAIPKPLVKKFLYNDEYTHFQNIREKCGLLGCRTLDVQIIDIADEIAYAVHDLEDGLALHSFSIDDLMYELSQYEKDGITLDGDPGYEAFKNIVTKTKDLSSKSSTYRTLQEYSQVFRKELTSSLTHEFVNDLTLCQIDSEFAQKHGINVGNWEIRLDKYYRLREALSDTLFTCISRDPIIEDYERRGKIVVESLFSTYNNDPRLLPPDYRNKYMPRVSQERLTMDFISGMMDAYAIQEFEKYHNTKFDNIIL